MGIELLSLCFNHDPSSANRDALNIRRNAQDTVRVPEWQRGVTVNSADSLAAYSLADVLGNTVTLQARFWWDFPGVTAVQVRAVQPPLPPGVFQPTSPGLSWQALLQTQVNVLGNVAPAVVTLTSPHETGNVLLALENTRFASCGVGTHEVVWHWQYRLGIGNPWIWFATTRHRIYTVAKMPQSAWLQQPAVVSNTFLPWTDALDFACSWARGTRTPEEAAATITRTLYGLGLNYDCLLGASAYTYGFDQEYVLLSEFIELLRGGVGRGRYVNCSDCAALVSTFANVLGADLWQSRMGGLENTGGLGYFPVKPLRSLGSKTWGLPCGWPGWTFHEVAWTGACDSSDNVYDACLELDKYPPYHVSLIPTNLFFGWPGQNYYRGLLATPEGQLMARPTPHERRRRIMV